jgi:hypothetical protein
MAEMSDDQDSNSETTRDLAWSCRPDARDLFVRAELVLSRVHTIASAALNGLQGRPVDEEHRKAFIALSLIVREIQNG